MPYVEAVLESRIEFWRRISTNRHREIFAQGRFHFTESVAPANQAILKVAAKVFLAINSPA